MFQADDAILKNSGFPMGIPFDHKTKKGVEGFVHLIPNKKTHRLVLMPIYWHISNGECTTAKGTPNEGTHDIFQTMGTDAYAWMTTMTDAKEGALPFSEDL